LERGRGEVTKPGIDSCMFVFAPLLPIAIGMERGWGEVTAKRNPALIKMRGSIKSIYQTIITRNMPYGKLDHLFIIF
jgi:hypothetical protein